MVEVGIDLTAATPKVLANETVQASDYVITLGCGDACPIFHGTTYLDRNREAHWNDVVRPVRGAFDRVRRVDPAEAGLGARRPRPRSLRPRKVIPWCVVTRFDAHVHLIGVGYPLRRHAAEAVQVMLRTAYVLVRDTGCRAWEARWLRMDCLEARDGECIPIGDNHTVRRNRRRQERRATNDARAAGPESRPGGGWKSSYSRRTTGCRGRSPSISRAPCAATCVNSLIRSAPPASEQLTEVQADLASARLSPRRMIRSELPPT